MFIRLNKFQFLYGTFFFSSSLITDSFNIRLRVWAFFSTPKFFDTFNGIERLRFEQCIEPVHRISFSDRFVIYLFFCFLSNVIRRNSSLCCVDDNQQVRCESEYIDTKSSSLVTHGKMNFSCNSHIEIMAFFYFSISHHRWYILTLD